MKVPFLDIENHPAINPVSINGISRNVDGLCLEKDIKNRISDAINEYDEIKELYDAELNENIYHI